MCFLIFECVFLFLGAQPVGRQTPGKLCGQTREQPTFSWDREVRYWHIRSVNMKAKFEALRKDIANKSYVVLNKKRSRGAQYFKTTVRGGYALAFRRNLGHGGGQLITTALEVGVVLKAT